MNRKLKHIVIVGGGTAGWMTAAGLSHFLRGQAQRPDAPRITLIESDEIGTIGVGEASIPTLTGFNRLLGIDEREFLDRTQGTFKLAIEFVNWTRQRHRFFHPFGSFGQPLDICDFHHHWLRAHAAGAGGDLDAYCLNTLLARENRFGGPTQAPNTPLSTVGHAYHFDAGLYARYLRGYAEQRGVVRVEGRITTVDQDPDNGFVTAVHLQSGQAIAGDLFVDCSGFRGLLIGETMKSDFIDWTGLLPCNRAVAVPSARTEPVTPYTRATARDAGWQWHIPLRHRTGNGHVYSSEHISDDEATAVLMANLDGEALDEPRLIRFRTGRRQKAWVKNVVAIGLAAGFLEPLESTGIHLTQKGVLKLVKCLPDLDFAPELVDEFNTQTAFDYEDVRDFLSLHYKSTERDDTPFWVYNKHNTVSDSLRHRMNLFEQSGRIFVAEQELFKMGSWLSVMWHQGLRPRGYDPIADALPQNELDQSLAFLRDTFARVTAEQPSHSAFLNANFKT